jgi:delta-aminolevulinic acid dehydratase/porphobilinogen synthase
MIWKTFLHTSIMHYGVKVVTQFVQFEEACSSKNTNFMQNVYEIDCSNVEGEDK